VGATEGSWEGCAREARIRPSRPRAVSIAGPLRRWIRDVWRRLRDAAVRSVGVGEGGCVVKRAMAWGELHDGLEFGQPLSAGRWDG
jgi:hypothetical protein